MSALRAYLDKLNLCPHCKLRFFGYLDYQDYYPRLSENLAQLETEIDQCPQNTASPPRGEEPSADHGSRGLCLGCLNILPDLETLIIANGASIEAYDETTFLAGASTPVFLTLVNYIILENIKVLAAGHAGLKRFRKITNEINLGAKRNTAASESILDLRQIVKYMVGYLMKKLFNRDFHFSSPLLITLSYTHAKSNLIVEKVSGLTDKLECIKQTKKLRQQKAPPQFTAVNLLKAVREIPVTTLNECFDVSSNDFQSTCRELESALICQHTPVYIGGRYTKFSRSLSQTPWLVNEECRLQGSLEDFIKDPFSDYTCDGIVFSSSGREDIDVRMLNEGRPFVLEFINPRSILGLSREYLAEVTRRINASTLDVRVAGLQYISKDSVTFLREGETDKRKHYCAVVFSTLPFTDTVVQRIKATSDLEIRQKTPIRVLHRRSLLTRLRTVHKMGFERINDHFGILTLEAQAGTYIKEFVHSDLGRTSPSLASLVGDGAQCDILQLDVSKVEMDWPPRPAPV